MTLGYDKTYPNHANYSKKSHLKMKFYDLCRDELLFFRNKNSLLILLIFSNLIARNGRFVYNHRYFELFLPFIQSESMFDSLN